MEEILKPFSVVMGSTFIYAITNEYENVITLVFDSGQKIEIYYEGDDAGDVYLKSNLVE